MTSKSLIDVVLVKKREREVYGIINDIKYN